MPLRAMMAGAGLVVSVVTLFLGFTGCTGVAGQDDVADLLQEVGEPVVIIDTPAHGAVLSEALVVVTGTLAESTDGPMLVNGVQARLEPPLFSVTIVLNEGENEIIAVHQPSGVSHSVTVTLDTLPPALLISAPGQGTVYPQIQPVTVTFATDDESGVALAVVNGQGCAVSNGQGTSEYTGGTTGLNIVSVVAVDNHGLPAREHAAVLLGPFEECERDPAVPDLTLDLGPAGLLALGKVLSGLIAMYDFQAAFVEKNPVYESETLAVSLDSLSFSTPQVTLWAQGSKAAGRLHLDVVLDELNAGGNVTFSGLTKTWFLDAAVEGVALNVTALLSNKDGVLAIQLEEMEVDADSFSLSGIDENGEVVVTPVEVSGNFLDVIGQLAADIVIEEANARLADVQEYLSGEYPLALAGFEIEVSYELLDMFLVGGGVRGLFGVDVVETAGAEVHPWSWGCPQLTSGPPSPDFESPLSLGISVELINRILVRLWSGGYLDFLVGQELLDSWKVEMDMVAGMLGSLLEFLPEPVSPETPLAVQIGPMLPPLVSPTVVDDNGKQAYTLGLGAFRLDFMDMSGAGKLMARAVFSAIIELDATLGAGSIDLKLEPMEFFLDLEGLSGEGKRRAEADIEQHFEVLVPEVLGGVFEMLVSFELPGLFGLKVVDAVADSDMETGHIRVRMEAVAGVGGEP